MNNKIDPNLPLNTFTSPEHAIREISNTGIKTMTFINKEGLIHMEGYFTPKDLEALTFIYRLKTSSGTMGELIESLGAKDVHGHLALNGQFVRREEGTQLEKLYQDDVRANYPGTFEQWVNSDLNPEKKH